MINIPFNFQPISNSIKIIAPYTVPTNRYAHVQDLAGDLFLSGVGFLSVFETRTISAVNAEAVSLQASGEGAYAHYSLSASGGGAASSIELIQSSSTVLIATINSGSTSGSFYVPAGARVRAFVNNIGTRSAEFSCFFNRRKDVWVTPGQELMGTRYLVTEYVSIS